MLNADMNSLSNDTVTDSLVDYDSDGSLSDVEDAACLAMVELVRHSQMLRRIGFDVNILSHFEVSEVFRNSDGSVVAERLLVEMSSPGIQTEAVRHFTLIIIKIPPEGAFRESIDNTSKQSKLVKRNTQSLPQRRYRSNTVIPPPQATVASLII